ncbi:MAG: MFS transporter, partial [Planctomycetota bacterium]
MSTAETETPDDSAALGDRGDAGDAGDGGDGGDGGGVLSRIYPFRALPNPTKVWAWGMYDLANQSFALLILTLFFPVFFKEVVVGDPQKGDSTWSIIASISLALTVVVSPVLGAVGDCRRMKKKLLIGSGIACCTLTACLALLGPGGVWLAAVLFIPANVAFNLGSNFMASYLPTLATSRNMGRVSAIGWTMGYIGALLLMLVSLGAMFAFGLEETAAWRPFFVFAAVWYAMNMVPAAVVLREPACDVLPGDSGWIVTAAFRRIRETVVHAARFRQLFRFLLAFLVYGLGVQVMIKFASILAADFGIEKTGLVVFVAQLTVTAMITAAATARFQDKIGAKATVLIYTAVWLVSCLGLVAVTIAFPVDPPQWLFWMVGNGIGIGLGGIGTSSRAMVGRFSPAARTAEFFGLWGL